LCGDKRLGSYIGSCGISNFDSGVKWGVEAGVFAGEENVFLREKTGVA